MKLFLVLFAGFLLNTFVASCGCHFLNVQACKSDGNINNPVPRNLSPELGGLSCKTSNDEGVVYNCLYYTEKTDALVSSCASTGVAENGETCSTLENLIGVCRKLSLPAGEVDMYYINSGLGSISSALEATENCIALNGTYESI